MVCVVGRMRDLILQLSKSSIYSTKPLEVYRASKAALNQFMRSYAIRQSTLYPNRAFLLAPGWIRTDMGGSNGAFSLEEAIPDIIKTIEQKQGKP